MEKDRTAIALGSFDGLHKGHRAVIDCALSYKEHGLVPVALLFDRHPLLSLSGSAPEEILQNEIRSEMLAKAGVKASYISFEEIRNLSPSDFLNKILIKRYNAGAVCCGSNYRFGKDGCGTPEILSALCNEAGIAFSVCEDMRYDGELISSTRIRSAIKSGNIPLANSMLGYEFGYRAEVVHGESRGHLIGYPTINQYFREGFIIPKSGVYASVSVVDGKEYPSVTNIGMRPSFEDDDLRSETNIIGFEGDLYGRIIDVHLLEYLRGEIKFDGFDPLAKQIRADSEKSVEIFRKRGESHV